MIVKILSAASNFEGIDYNERKNDKGKSELLECKNFEGLGHSYEEHNKNDYINYMKLVAGLNNRVKNKQFHAIISTKGREHNPEELKNIAVQYLEKMGYSKNPYLIYSHSDTDNNHVHLVSTRVDKNGRKVNEKYERIRSQNAIQEILQKSPRHEANIAIAKALKYNFSTVAQFKLLLEQEGFKIKDSHISLELIKYGKVQTTFNKNQIDSSTNNYKAPNARIKQLKAVFYKYKPGLNLNEFINFTKDKFGIDIILHQAKGKDKPYGYSIIDNSSKEVLKGSQIMPMSNLLSASKSVKLQKANFYIQSILLDNSTFSGLRKEMTKLGFDIDNKGDISLKGKSKSTFHIEKELLKRLRYNDRVGEASQYSYSTDQEKQALAKLFYIKANDMVLNPQKGGIHNRYHDMFSNIHQPNKINDVLEGQKIRTMKHSGNFFLIDDIEKAIIMIDKNRLWSIDLDDLEKIDLDLNNKLTEGIQTDLDYKGHGILNLIFNTLSEGDYSRPEEKKRKKRSI